MKWKYENAASAPARFAGTLAAVSFHRRRSVSTSRRTRSSPTMYTLFAMIGASPPRKEDRRLLTGAGRYVDDLTREGMLHLGVVRSAEAHARITKLALDEARALPGVVAAWSAAELPEAARAMPGAYGAGKTGRPWGQPILAKDVVRYVGEPVAVVVAESAYRVADALELAQVGYEPLPALATVEAALASTTRVHDGWPDNAALTVRGAVGDAERALATADVVVHERLRHPRLAAVPIETRGVLAYRDGDSGALVVWSSTQSPYRLRDIVAAALELPVEHVRVRVPDVGGAFGPKGSVYPEEILVAAAALRLGRPVKWVETRRESFAGLGHDRAQSHEVRIGFARDGRIVAIDDRFFADVGAYPAEEAGLTANTVNHLPGPYRVAHYRNVGTNVVTNKTLNAAYRGAGRPEAVFVMERLMDLGARRLGLDPAEIRRRNLVRPDEMPYRPGLTYKDGVPIAQSAGSERGGAFEAVGVSGGDTTLFPFGRGRGGSRVMANAGPAVARTAREVRARAARVAAELLECAPEDVRIEASRAFVAGVPTRGVGLGRLAHAAIKSKALRTLGEPGLNACTYFHPETVTWAFGTHAAVVEVDVEACLVRLLAYAIVHDPGRAINPTIVEGQLQGGAAQSIGAGLMEEVVHDEHGQLLTASLMDYAIPTADHLPPLPVALEAHPSTINPLGVKGVGESGAIPGAAAIANAVEDAVADLGLVVREDPVTSARLFLMLHG